MAETIREYLDTVQEQIRWKRARPVVARELEQHLNDQRGAFLEEGNTPETAERLAVEEMGDPVSVGTALDRVHRPRPQWGMLAAMAVSLCGWLALRLFERYGVSYFPEYIWRFDAIALLACGVAAWGLIMMPANLIVTPYFTGMPVDAIRALLLPIILPFNLIKAGINAIVTFLVYKSVSPLLHR